MTKALLSVAALCLGALPLSAQPDQAHVPGRIVVQKRISAGQSDVNRALASSSAHLLRTIPQTGHYILAVPDAQVDRIMQNLEKTGLFTVVERDGVAHGGAVPNDPSFASQWHLAKIQAPAAWDVTTGSASLPIAVIDSGVNSAHPDLAGRITAGWSFLLGNSNTSDVLGHGTAVAGSLGAATNNLIGVAGVTWRNPIMPLVVLNSNDYASYSDIASAIMYAADHGVRIINVSIGGTSSSSLLQSAVNYAWNKGAVVFAAAMNNSNSTPNYPAACNNAVAVSATTSSDLLASFSNYGTWIDLAAPGNNILTTNNSGGYSYWYGTSFSSPITAGVAALVLSADPALSAPGLVSLLESNSDDLGTAGFDIQYGWGRVNAAKAVSAARAISGSAPSVSIASPTSNSSVAGAVTISGAAAGSLGIAQVNLYCDSTLIGSTAAANYSFSWNSGAFTAGAHTLSVQALDSAGNTGSASVQVNVTSTAAAPDTIAPVVSITSPAAGASVAGTVSVDVSASDNVGVQQVSIYIDDVLAYTGTAAPYTYRWNTKKVAAGSHTISAQAWDAAGNSTKATPVSVFK